MNKKIKLGIIARDLSKQLGGTKTYSYKILEQLNKILDDNKKFKINVLLNEESIKRNDVWKNLNIDYVNTKNSLKLEVFEALKWARKNKFDVIISFKHFLLPFKLLNYCKLQGITIHDVGYLVSTKLYGLKETLKTKIIYFFMVFYNDFFITVSNFSKKEIIKHLNINRQKVLVTGLAVNKFFKSKKHFSKEKYFLIMDNSKRKNIDLIINSYIEVKEKIPENLYIVGKDKKASALVKLNSNRIKRLGYVTNLELSNLYRNATAFIFFSSYEGFGIPLLEAQSNGCPVICSDIKAFKEVGGDSVCFVKDNSLIALQEEMIDFSKNNIKRKHYIKKGYENCKRFSWHDNANKILLFIEREYSSVILR